MADKPCGACPWMSKDQRDIDAVGKPEMQKAMKAGQWFCCHVNMGDCHGAVLRHQQHLSKETS